MKHQVGFGGNQFPVSMANSSETKLKKKNHKSKSKRIRNGS